MRILLANKFYYPRGGDCIHTIALENLLKAKGNDVAIFSMNHPQNLSNPYDNYWPSALEYSAKKLNNLRESLSRPLFSREIKLKFTALVNDFKPDIVHLNNIHTQLSPLIAEIAYRHKIPTVWTLHDFKLICPAYSCLRDGVPCELCFKDKKNVIKYKCIKQSLLGSTIAYLEAVRWSLDKLQKYTECFICPSQFMRQKMIEGGFDPNKFQVVNNFIPNDKLTNHSALKSNYYCYVGRLSAEKGILTLLQVAAKLKDFKLIVVGTGPLENDLKKNFVRNNIEFLGFKEWPEIDDILSKALFSVMPTECYDNFPTSIIESMVLGTPVIGSRIGGVPEMIKDGDNGLLFNPGDQGELAERIALLFNDHSLRERLSIAAYEDAVKRYDPEVYYEQLIDLYHKLQINYYLK